MDNVRRPRTWQGVDAAVRENVDANPEAPTTFGLGVSQPRTRDGLITLRDLLNVVIDETEPEPVPAVIYEAQDGVEA